MLLEKTTIHPHMDKSFQKCPDSTNRVIVVYFIHSPDGTHPVGSGLKPVKKIYFGAFLATPDTNGSQGPYVSEYPTVPIERTHCQR
jgi:hypothetical protein